MATTQSAFYTIVNKTTTYRAKRLFDEPLGNWTYRWNIQSTLTPADLNEVIANCDQAFNGWITSSFIDVEFLRPTINNEYFAITCEIQQTDCISTQIINVVVNEHYSQLTCTNPISLTSDTGCLYSDATSEIISGYNKYTYKYTCTDDIDEVYFSINGGWLYDPTGILYPTQQNVKVLTDDTNTAYIKVHWHSGPITQYAGQTGFKLSAYSKSGDRISNVSVLEQYPIPVIPVGYIINPSSTLQYNSVGNNISFMLQKINNYYSDYRIEVYYRSGYSSTTTIEPTSWSAWYDLIPAEYGTKLLVSEIPSISQKTFSTTFNIDDYVSGMDYLWYEFNVKVYWCDDEGTCEATTLNNCLTENTWSDIVPLTHCVTEIDYHTLFNIVANGCPGDITPGSFNISGTLCDASTYSLDAFSYVIS